MFIDSTTYPHRIEWFRTQKILLLNINCTCLFTNKDKWPFLVTYGKGISIINVIFIRKLISVFEKKHSWVLFFKINLHTPPSSKSKSSTLI